MLCHGAMVCYEVENSQATEVANTDLKYEDLEKEARHFCDYVFAYYLKWAEKCYDECKENYLASKIKSPLKVEVCTLFYDFDLSEYECSAADEA